MSVGKTHWIMIVKVSGVRRANTDIEQSVIARARAHLDMSLNYPLT